MPSGVLVGSVGAKQAVELKASEIQVRCCLAAAAWLAGPAWLAAWLPGCLAAAAGPSGPSGPAWLPGC